MYLVWVCVRVCVCGRRLRGDFNGIFVQRCGDALVSSSLPLASEITAPPPPPLLLSTQLCRPNEWRRNVVLTGRVSAQQHNTFIHPMLSPRLLFDILLMLLTVIQLRGRRHRRIKARSFRQENLLGPLFPTSLLSLYTPHGRTGNCRPN